MLPTTTSNLQALPFSIDASSTLITCCRRLFPDSSMTLSNNLEFYSPCASAQMHIQHMPLPFANPAHLSECMLSSLTFAVPLPPLPFGLLRHCLHAGSMRAFWLHLLFNPPCAAEGRRQ